jgi:hypothetical protein
VTDNAIPQPDVREEARAYSFGPFRLEADQAVLLHDGASLNLRPKSFDVLHYLVRHPQRLVSREELLRAAWPDVVVTDDSLTQCLIEIRKVLDDREKRIVRTVPRRGYRGCRRAGPWLPCWFSPWRSALPGGVPVRRRREARNRQRSVSRRPLPSLCCHSLT